MHFLDDLAQDIRHGARQLLKHPGFAALAILSLALGIAANTTIFSFVNALLLAPTPVEHPDQLWQVWQSRLNDHSSRKPYSVWGPAEAAFLREHNRTFAILGAFDAEPNYRSWSRNGLGERVQTLFVSGNFFDICGIQPARGRFFTPEEDVTPGTHPVVVVSHTFWKEKLHADANIIGQGLTINGARLTIVGVAQASFTGTTAGVRPDMWVPFMMAPMVAHDAGWLTRTDSHHVIVLGRLKPEVTAMRAAADLTALTHRFQEEIQGKKPEANAILMPSLMVPVPMRGIVRAFTATLMGAVVLVLLIACANAANLQLAKAKARESEMAVRTALGASRGRVVRQLLTESALLAFGSGLLGLLLAVWIAHILVSLIPSSLPLRFSTVLDWRVLAFTLFASVGTGLLFGMVPALRGSRSPSLPAQAQPRSTRRSRFTNALIVGQLAVCLVLLLAASLCLQSLAKASAFRPGFDVLDRVVLSYSLGDFGLSREDAKKFFAQLLDRTESTPGVRSAAWTSRLPLGMERSNGTFQLEGQERGTLQSGRLESFRVGPRYFATTGTRVLLGREFNSADREDHPRVVVINEVAATQFWPGQNPIGRRLFVGEPTPENSREIVGVVETGRYVTLGEDPKAAFFECFNQAFPLAGTLVVHAHADPKGVLTALQNVTQETNPLLAPTVATTMTEHLAIARFPTRTSGMLLGVLGVVALILAASGLFGVIAYSVAQRNREVGIRMALGAQRRDVRLLILRQGMRLAALGVGIGLPLAFAATRFLRALLFGISPADPLSFVLVPIFLLLIACLACWLPACRASNASPMAALRSE